MKLKTAAVVMLISALALAACDDTEGNSPANSTDKLSAVITPEGSTMSSKDGSWEIEFSAGAVTEPTTISITTWPEGTKTVPEGYEGIFKVLEFNPHGIEFHSAVTLRIYYEQGDMPEDGIEERMLGFYYVNDDGAIEEATSTVDTAGNCIEVQLPHFSFGMPLKIAIRLVNAGILTNEVIVGMIADSVADELNSMSPEERDAFIEDNIGILGPFTNAIDDILDENPVAGLISADMIFYSDLDGDGYGNPDETTYAVTAPAGYVDNNSDCNDTQDEVYPGHEEIPDDGLDNDCDGMIDEGYFFRDADYDGYGDPNQPTGEEGATAPAGYVDNDLDCNDTRGDINPGSLEISGDGLDNNCDGVQGVTLLSAVQSGGVSRMRDSSRILLTFDAYPTTLTTGNITVTGATKGTLWYSGNPRTLEISNITADNEEEITVTVTNPAGYSIAGSEQNVQVFRNNFALANTIGQKVVTRVGDIEFNMVYVNNLDSVTIPAGADDTGTATLTTKIFMGETEVTWELWKEVYDWAVDPERGANQYTFENPGRMGSVDGGSGMTDRHPVTMITWRDALVWCNALSEMTGVWPTYVSDGTGIHDHPAGMPFRSSVNDSYLNGANVEQGLQLEKDLVAYKGFRLASSAEWEYAARYIGATAPVVQYLATDCLYYNKDGQFTSLTEGYYWTPGDYSSGAVKDYTSETETRGVAWYSYDPAMDGTDKSMPVGQKAANQLGIYDMNGNVWEWCFTASGSNRMRRGGSWTSTNANMVVSAGDFSAPDYYDSDISFRLVKTQ